mgnify:FL=1
MRNFWKRWAAGLAMSGIATLAAAEPAKTLSLSAWQFLQAGRGDQIWQVLAGYEQTQPDVGLKKVAYPYSSYIKTISTQLGARSGPDLLLLNDVDLANFARAGVLEPLDDVVDEGLRGRLAEVNDLARVDGKRYALNFDTVTFALVWNRTLLAQAGVQPPRDFAGLLAASQAVREKAGVPGYGERNQTNNEEQLWNAISTWTIGYGGVWSKDGKLTIDAPANVQALADFKKLQAGGGVAVGDDFSTLRTRFAQGKIGMLIESSSNVQSILSSKDAAIGAQDIGIGRPPFPLDAVRGSSSYIAINAHGKNKAEAKQYLKWLFTPPVQQRLQEALGGSVVGTTQVPPPAAFLAGNPWASQYFKQAPRARTAVIVDFEEKTPQIRTIIVSEFAKVLLGNEDVAQALGLSLIHI